MTYAVLGATGATGSSILAILLKQDVPVNVYVRSRTKLMAQQPSILSNTNITVFEGQLTDIDLITNCIKDTKATFLAVATNDNTPDVSIAQDSSRVILAALDRLQQQQQHNSKGVILKLIILSSLGIDRSLAVNEPPFLRAIMSRCLGYLYADLIAAEDMIRGSDMVRTGKVQVAFFKPGALSRDGGAEKGYELSSERGGEGMLGYMDLARAMIEVANAEGSSNGVVDWPWNGKNIGVLPKGTAAVEWANALRLLKGLLYNYMPWMYHWLG